MNYEPVIPSDVPTKQRDKFIKNMRIITHNTGRLFLFAADHKIEHLNNDFDPSTGTTHPDALHPEHLFKIASRGRIGALATHPGLITRYAASYPNINYIVKMNARTNLAHNDNPKSALLYKGAYDFERFTQAINVPVCGVGFTLYIGSSHEAEMLTQAAEIVDQAHQEGLVAILWIYARGTAITNDHTPQILAGAAGLANALGADFVKIKAPDNAQDPINAESLKIATIAAGNTSVICSGGPKQDTTEQLLKSIYNLIHRGGAMGCAVGRNIFQRSLPEAIAITNAISTIVFDNAN